MPDNDAVGPQSQAAFELLLDGLPPDAAETHNSGEAIGNMAVANIVVRFEAKMEAQPEALRRELGLLRWMFGFCALIAAAIAQVFRPAS